MMKHNMALICCTIAISWSLSSMVNANVTNNTPQWQFQTEQKMDEAIYKYAGDPLSTYHVIMHAAIIHKAGEATLVYKSLVMRSPKDPYLASAYGFCQMMADSCLSYDFAVQYSTPAAMKARSLQMNAGIYRDQAYAAKPNDPVVLMERGIELSYTGLLSDRTMGAECLKKATLVAPSLADTHFWYANALSDLAAMEVKSNVEKHLSISEYEKAVSLDPKLKCQALIGESGPYSLLHQYATAVKCIDQAIAMDPSQAKNKGLLLMRKIFVKAE